LWKERRLRVFEDRELSKIFGLMMDEGRGNRGVEKIT
jgi:hypothetical protein